MKKFFTLTMLLLAFVFCAKAQSLLYEGFDTGVLPAGWTTVDADGDGYSWDAEYPYMGGFETQAGEGCISSASYLNGYGALTPDNWLISPTVTIPAATDNAELTFYVKGQDANDYAENYDVYVGPTANIADFTSVYHGTTTDEYVEVTVDLTEYAGQTIYIAFRHYNTTNMYWLNLDEVSVFANPTEPIISALPSTLAFGKVILGETSGAKQVNVIGYSITGNITATTSAPFAVSADGITFGTTATLTSAGGTLYVNFTPEMADSNNGIVTLSSEGAQNVTINVNGIGLDCSGSITEFPYTPDFANGIAENCWTINSTTAETWTTYSYNGTTYASCSGLQGTAQDEELISKSLDFSQHSRLIYMDLAFLASPYFASQAGQDSLTTFTLYASTDGGNTWGTDPIWNLLDEGDFQTYVRTNATIDLSSLAGEANVKLKFKYEGDLYSSQVLVGDIRIYTYDVPSVEANQDTMSFVARIGDAAEDMAIVNFILADEATATTTAPFAVSADGINFSTTATIANSGDTLFIQYIPEIDGVDNGSITLSVTDGADYIIVLNGTGIDCSTNGTVPFTEGFEYNGTLPLCYEFIYGDNDPSVNTITNANDANGDGYTVRFSSMLRTTPSTQYMISPAINYTGTAELEVSFDARAYSSYGNEVFSIGYSTNSNDTSDFIWGTEYTTNGSTTYNNYFMIVPANTQYVGIRYSSDYQYYLYVDNFSVKEATPSIRPIATALDFGTVYLGNEKMQQVTVIGASLTGDINITANAPFAVSTDSVNFATTATLPSNGGIMYVKYAPTAATTDNDVITLSSTGVNDTTIAVTGNGYDCNGIISTIPYTNNFNDTIVPPMCWIVGAADNYTYVSNDTATGDYGIAFLALDYMISPEIEDNDEDMWVSFDFLTYIPAASYDVPDAFRVGYSTTANLNDFTWLEEVTIDYDMTDYETHRELVPAGTKYVAIELTEMNTYYQYGFYPYDNYLFIDNFTIDEAEPAIVANPTSINFGGVQVNTTATENAAVMGVKLTEGITATTTAPFAVSTDGTNFDVTATLDSVGGTLYIQYAPTVVATNTGSVVLTSDTLTATIALSGAGFDCSQAVSLPFTEDFESELNGCWQNIDNDGDGFKWEYGNSGNGCTSHNGEQCMYSESFSYDLVDALTPENYLISPAIAIPTEGAYMTWFDAAQDPTYPADHYEVMVSTSTDINTFTSIFECTLSTDEWTERQVNLANYAGQNIHVAFVHNNCTDNFLMKIDDINIEAGNGIEENTLNTVSVYPNPAHTVLNVNAVSAINMVEVYSLTGSKIAAFNGNGNDAQINVSNLANGMYFVKIITNDGTTTKKFNVAR